MLRVVTCNLNGIRSAAKKGFFAWVATLQADVICVQEIKAQAEDIQQGDFQLPGYHAYFHHAEKKGYSGVGVYTKIKPLHVKKGLEWSLSDSEGRHLEVDLGDCSIISLYMPSGTSGDERQAIKFQFLEVYENYLKKIKQTNRPYVICGDWNIAHQQRDLKNWRSNQKNSGFLPEERAWMDKVFGELQFVDAFREKNQGENQYTWWSNRGQAWAKNVGWRIDYQVVTPELKQAVQAVSIYKDQRFSDHAPLIVDYDWHS